MGAEKATVDTAGPPPHGLSYAFQQNGNAYPQTETSHVNQQAAAGDEAVSPRITNFIINASRLRISHVCEVTQ